MPRQRIVCQFSVSDIADLCGCSTSAIFHHIRRGNLVLEDLVSVTKFIASRARDEIRADIGYAFGRIGEYGAPIPPSKKADSQKEVQHKHTTNAKAITRIQG